MCVYLSVRVVCVQMSLLSQRLCDWMPVTEVLLFNLPVCAYARAVTVCVMLEIVSACVCMCTFTRVLCVCMCTFPCVLCVYKRVCGGDCNFMCILEIVCACVCMCTFARVLCVCVCTFACVLYVYKRVCVGGGGGIITACVCVFFQVKHAHAAYKDQDDVFGYCLNRVSWNATANGRGTSSSLCGWGTCQDQRF